MSKLFNLNIKDILGAVASAVIVAILTYVANLGDIKDINLQTVLSIVVLTMSASLAKSLATDHTGKFLGSIQVK